MKKFFRGSVYVNIYDYSRLNCILDPLGIGLYHTGVQIGNVQYMFCVLANFDDTGMVGIEPKSMNLQFTKQIDMGLITISEHQLDLIKYQYSRKYLVNTYHLLSNNCNHFANDFIRRLTGKQLPDYLFRISNAANTLCGCCIPNRLVDGSIILQNE